jgi:hypothetical protein
MSTPGSRTKDAIATIPTFVDVENPEYAYYKCHGIAWQLAVEPLMPCSEILDR